MKMESSPADDNPEVILFEVEGVVDSVNVTDFFQFVNKLFKDGARMLVMDLSWTNYLSSGALSVIADAFKKAESLGGGMVICGASDSVKELFSVVQFDRIFDFYPDITTAVASFSGVDSEK